MGRVCYSSVCKEGVTVSRNANQKMHCRKSISLSIDDLDLSRFSTSLYWGGGVIMQ